MPDPVIEQLLRLQEHDARCDNVRHQLEFIPREVANFESRILAEEQKAEQARLAVRQTEVRRKDLETRLAGAEDQRGRYRTQQMQVKKNEEYKALQHEIDQVGEQISRLEDEDIEILILLDEVRAQQKRVEAESATVIAELRGHIAQLRRNETGFQAQLVEAEQAVAAAEVAVEPKHLQMYRYVKSRVRKAPFVVAVRDQKCTGCFLRISSDSLAEARKGSALARCDSCGRLLYLEH